MFGIVEPFSLQATIEKLSVDILLDVFHHCLNDTPKFWPTLTCVCQRWRQIVHTSPLGLNLRLHFTPGAPVLKVLENWPVLPIVLQYGGFSNIDSPAPEEDVNIIAALKQSGRVTSIRLTATSSLLEKFSAISEPFLELEELTILSPDNMNPNLPNTFRWGPRLRTLHLSRIPLPSFPQLLSPSQGLVDLRLDEIPRAGYFSPYAFANALFGMSRLETLSLHFVSLPSRRNYFSLPPTGERNVLPALTCLKYRGTSKYLDCLVARIDTPSLKNIDIAFFSQPTIDASELGRFIERIEAQASPNQAEIETTAEAISVSFSNANVPSPLRLQISCRQLDWQLSCMTQVCDQFSPFLFRVQTLGIDSTKSLKQDDLGGEQWLELVRSFGGLRSFSFAGEPMADFLCALNQANDRHTSLHTSNTDLLPALRNIRVQKIMSIAGSFWEAAHSFITVRHVIGQPIDLQVLCHICDTSFTQRKGLNRHLVDKHKYRIVCSHCGDFEYTLGRILLFRKHLESEHPEVVRNDALMWHPYLTDLLLSQPEILVNRYGSPSPRSSNLVVPSITVTGPALDSTGPIPTPDDVAARRNVILSLFLDSFAPSPP